MVKRRRPQVEAEKYTEIPGEKVRGKCNERSANHPKIIRHISSISVLIILIALISTGIIFVKTFYAVAPYINMHVHMQNLSDAEQYLEIAGDLGIGKTLLLGSSDKTLYSRSTFTHYDENNNELLKIKGKYPDNFDVLCTTYWHDPDQVKK